MEREPSERIWPEAADDEDVEEQADAVADFI